MIPISDGSLTSATVGLAIYAACQWGTISLLARLGSPEVVGQYALGVAVSTPILMLSQLRRQRSGTADIRILSLVFALLGIAAVGFLDHSVQDRMTVLLVIMGQSVEWIAEIYGGRRDAISLSLHGTLSVAVLGILMATTGRSGAGLLGVLIVRLLLLFLYDFRRDESHRSAQARLPSASEIMFLSFAAGVPCYFVAHMWGYHFLGIFAAVASLTPSANVLITALGQAATPELATLYREGDHGGFKRLTIQLAGAGLLLGLCAVAGAIIAGPWLSGILFGPEYAAHSMLVLALAASAGVGFVGSLLGYVLAAGRRSNESASLQIAAIAATSLAAVALVPRLGIEGAAFAAGFGFLIQITGQLWVLRAILTSPRQPVLLALLNDPLSASARH